jgi:hypothetical protein
MLPGGCSRHYSRFRAIYRIAEQEIIVLVISTGCHAQGIHADIYRLIERALQRYAPISPDESSSPGSEASGK